MLSCPVQPTKLRVPPGAEGERRYLKSTYIETVKSQWLVSGGRPAEVDSVVWALLPINVQTALTTLADSSAADDPKLTLAQLKLTSLEKLEQIAALSAEHKSNLLSGETDLLKESVVQAFEATLRSLGASVGDQTEVDVPAFTRPDIRRDIYYTFYEVLYSLSERRAGRKMPTGGKWEELEKLRIKLALRMPVRGRTFPCASAFILSKTDAFACGAADHLARDDRRDPGAAAAAACADEERDLPGDGEGRQESEQRQVCQRPNVMRRVNVSRCGLSRGKGGVGGAGG